MKIISIWTAGRLTTFTQTFCKSRPLTDNCGVCHSDVHLQDGYFNLGDEKQLDASRGQSLPFTLGHEVEGEVVSMGPDASGAAIGDRVLVYPWIGCDECPICARGDGHVCNRPRAIGVNLDGGYADHCLVPDGKYLFPYDDLNPSLAATYACSGITAYGALCEAGEIRADEHVLIIGLGGVGMMGLAFAKEIVFTAERFDAARALTMGLANRVLAAAELEPTVSALAETIAANAPLTVAAMKRTIGEIAKDPAERDREMCRQVSQACFDSEDYIEGRRAFMEKRKAVFVGR